MHLPAIIRFGFSDVPEIALSLVYASCTLYVVIGNKSWAF